MAIDVCIAMPLPPTPPSIEIPYFGILEKAQGALDSIPDAGDLLAGFQDQLAVALTPVRQLLELIEALMAFDACMRAVPKAIINLDPQPIYDCLKALTKIITLLAKYIPPMPYIVTIIELASFCIDAITQIYVLLQRLNTIVGEYLDLLNIAQALGDAQLELYVRCGMEEVKAVTLNIFTLLAFIKPGLDVLLDPISKKIDNAVLREAVKTYTSMDSYFVGAKAAILAGEELEQPPGLSVATKVWNPDVPVPPLEPLLAGLGLLQRTLATIYNVLAPFIGRDADKIACDPPSLTNL